VAEGRRTLRCAVYTRKSSEEGLEQAFNSLHAQREACEAYIKSQKHEGWTVVPTAYDDGGFSGGSMNRPGLQTLLADVKAGRVHVVVVYKIDRLTRSLFDFAKIVEVLDGAQASFVSVTQSFNTTTSMGRLTLNVLLSFAQFEREVTGERIRDKVAASKKKGMWMGGNIPLGYTLRDRKLVIDEIEAEVVRTIFRLYVKLGTVRRVKQAADRMGLRTKARPNGTGGLPFGTGHLYTLLKNPLYIGQVHHKGAYYPGEHAAIISSDIWTKVEAQIRENTVARKSGHNLKATSLLAGKIFDLTGQRLTPSHCAKGPRRYRYYASALVDEHGDAVRIPALEIEKLVLDLTRALLLDSNRLTDAVPGERSTVRLQLAITSARALADLLDTPAADIRMTVQDLLTSVRIGPYRLRLTLDRGQLVKALGVTDATIPEALEPLVIEHDVTLKRRGKQQRLILTTAAPESTLNLDLIKAIARAHRWWRMLRTGKFESIADLARRDKVPRTWISTQLPLAFLAPEIAHAILEGKQPAFMKLDRVLAIATKRDWIEQRLLLQA